MRSPLISILFLPFFSYAESLIETLPSKNELTLSAFSNTEYTNMNLHYKRLNGALLYGVRGDLFSSREEDASFQLKSLSLGFDVRPVDVFSGGAYIGLGNCETKSESLSEDCSLGRISLELKFGELVPEDKSRFHSSLSYVLNSMVLDSLIEDGTGESTVNIDEEIRLEFFKFGLHYSHAVAKGLDFTLGAEYTHMVVNIDTYTWNGVSLEPSPKEFRDLFLVGGGFQALF